MVSEILLAQLKWFTRKLIEKRIREIDGRHTPIDFDLAIITGNTNPAFDTNRTPEWHVIRMLEEIRGALVRSQAALPTELVCEGKDGHVEIRGYTTELLKKYLIDELGGPQSQFGEGRDENKHIILTYYEQPTTIQIRGNELAVFRHLLRGWGEVVSFEELHSAIENMHNLGQTAPLHHREQRTPTESQREAVRSAVNEVREKLKTATGHTEYPELIKSEHGVGYKMIL